ncbi:folliculin-interacting protein N-terminus-domain-containing protein [Chaetomium fimeti]|uniref:Folliculin-interacting protein N-terminus-domain-containing protein n=1 Tax=Chaetomium fimeti TaxID=1854472 RepID=A0AAE0HE88_9PEZI|nr:folliculin-interacting protein N-terminus-domain-containing protein [Chaetomium fimeti]
MLGKLFNLGAGSGTGAMPSPQPSSHRPFPLESVQEDIHTRHLLFPDPQDLYEHRVSQLYPLSSGATTPTGSTTNAYDYNADIELDVRDVRLIIMQDALSSVAASLLYDSQPAPPPRRNPASPRKPSVSYSQRPIIIQPGSPKIRQGAFDRRPSVHSRNQGSVESESQRAWREYREELATFSSCIFGNSELMAYKGTSTKVHVVPSEVRPNESGPMFGDGRGSLGRSTMRASRLSQSFSSENPPPFPPPPAPGGPNRNQDRKKVLITRLFPVNLPVEEEMPSFQGGFSEETAGYPFPQTAEDMKAKKKRFQPRQKRTPMYAVALIITLPPSSHSVPATLRSGFKGPSSYAEQDSFPSSFGSTRRSGWTMVGQGGFGGSESLESSYGNDMEDQIDAITQHWDIIMRTLSHLQTVVATTLFTMLRQIDLASPDPLPALSLQLARTSSAPGRRTEEGQSVKIPKTNAKHITLLPNCLLDNRKISIEMDAAKARIVAGIRASRVTTGQNRWPIWREEARWMAKWAGGKEQGFFFFNLLTGFLATHTDWLQALSPPAYRRRHPFQQHKGRSEEDTLVPSRTVILSDDKIAARRLVFLLSAFLPASQQLPGIKAHRPSTPASFGALSQSPPSFVVPILKEESLRRKINRRTGTRMPSHSRNLSLQTHNARSGAVPPPLAHLSMEGRHERRASDAASIRTTHLPIRGSDLHTRKSSAATTATILPETSIPHFSTAHRAELFAQGRPSSSNSIAADDLKRLTRDDSPGSQGSTAGERRQSSRWSVISTLWSARRRDSTSRSPVPSDGQNGFPASPVKPRQSSIAASSKTAPPEVGVVAPTGGAVGDARDDENIGPRDPTPPPRASPDSPAPCEQAGVPRKAQRIADPSSAFESPVKTSINIDDGIIDVDVPLPDFITSFESAVSSPSSSGYLSASGFGTGLDAFEQSFRFAADGDVPLNVAGWLQHYHPDFVLQALPAAQHDIIEEVKESMRAEPTPPLPLSSSPSPEDIATEKWIDVTSAIVADTTTFTITRIRYRRLMKLTPHTQSVQQLQPNNAAVVPTPLTASTTASSNPPPSVFDVQLKEEFIEEPVVAFDDVLIEAVERVIASAGTSTETTVSKVSSTSSSRSTSKRRERERETGRRDSLSASSGTVSVSTDIRCSGASSTTQGLLPVLGTGGSTTPQEVPRSQCKTVLLGALEDIIHDVIGEREQELEGSIGNRERESPLREAVRGWIESVDFGAGGD